MAFEDIVNTVNELNVEPVGLYAQLIVQMFAPEYAANAVSGNAFLKELRDAGVKIADETFRNIYGQAQAIDDFNSRILLYDPSKPIPESVFIKPEFNIPENYRYRVSYSYIDNKTGEEKISSHLFDTEDILSTDDVLQMFSDIVNNGDLQFDDKYDISVTGASISGAWSQFKPTDFIGF